MSESNKTHAIKYFEKHKGQFVIQSNLPHDIVVRLIGVGCNDMDYIFIYYDGRKLLFNTILDAFEPIKGLVSDRYYNGKISCSKLNDYDRPNDSEVTKMTDEAYELLLIEYRKSLEEHIQNRRIRLLSPLCWDLN